MQGHNRHISFAKAVFAVLTVLALGLLENNQLFAATLCVNPGGTGGCLSKIQTAVFASANGDTIQVAGGVYKEEVIIDRSVSLIGTLNTSGGGQGSNIDATGKPIGIFIDGIDSHGLNHVVVQGFTVANANFEGILVANASYVTLVDNTVLANVGAFPQGCLGIPAFETCGEGIHLVGVDHSIVANNGVLRNAGGILLSDDTGATHDNLITGNFVSNNAFGSGIALESHSTVAGGKLPQGVLPFGVFHNTIANNKSIHNGFQLPAGAGVGISSGVTAGKVFSNVVINNQLTGNGLPGVALHAHVTGLPPSPNLNDNMIAGNTISGNGADLLDAATPGNTGINVFGFSAIKGTIISQNVIDNEAFSIVINTPTPVDAHLNNFLDDTIGVDNLGVDAVNATENWWTCAAGPGAGAEECASVGGRVVFDPWLHTPFATPFK